MYGDSGLGSIIVLWMVGAFIVYVVARSSDVLTSIILSPIIGLIFFGFAGLIGGVVIGLLFGIGMIGQAFSGESK